MDSVSVLSSIVSQPVPPAARPVPVELSASGRVESDSLTLPSAEQVDSLNKLLQVHQQHLSFSVDESSGVSVLRVIDSDSGDLIRQMPSESWLKLARELAASTTGLLRTHA